jgi:hypothetical protein
MRHWTSLNSHLWLSFEESMTSAKLGIPRATFYRWYDRYLQRGEVGLVDKFPKPKHVWRVGRDRHHLASLYKTLPTIVRHLETHLFEKSACNAIKLNQLIRVSKGLLGGGIWGIATMITI